MATTQRTGSNPVRVEHADPLVILHLRRMGRHLRLTDQILSYDLDNIVIVDNDTAAPAWTNPDGETITINVRRMPGLGIGADRRAIAVWLGTNAHELFHNLFTPRSGSMLMRRVSAAERSTDRGIHRSWNILEDQRIERLGLARYGAWRGYLIAAMSYHISVTHPSAWTLVAGRTWLGDEARAIARAAFVATNDEASTRYCADLIGAYQRLADPGEADAVEAWQIINEFHSSFGSQLPPKGGCGGKTIDEGEPEDGDDGESIDIPTADEADEDDSAEGESDEDGDDDEGDDLADDGEGDTDGEGDDEAEGDEGDEGDEGSDGDDADDSDDDFGDEGDGESDGEAEGDDGDESDEDDGDADGGEGKSSDGDPDDTDGCSSPDGETRRRSMSEAIDEAIDEALGDDETAADMDRVVDDLLHGPSGGADLPKSQGEWQEVTAETRMLGRHVSDVLSDIKDDNEAAWIRRTDSGRFSVDRWATDPDWDADNVFDRFEAGQMDASSLDVVLVCDVSGSMGQQIYKLADATWAIRTAVDRVEGKCTVLGFGDDASMIFDGSHRPDGRVFIPMLEGSTNPTSACREAHRVVAGSAAANRIVIVLTDGSWWQPTPAIAAMQAAQREGAIVAVVGLGSGAARFVIPGFAGADVVALINDCTELVPFFREVTERSMLAAAGRLR
jgi:hypothetical protein